MKVDNFKVKNVEFIHGMTIVSRIVATVDITTGFLWKKKTVTREIEAGLGGIGPWRFTDTYDFTPDFLVEKLAFKYKNENLKGHWKNFCSE